MGEEGVTRLERVKGGGVPGREGDSGLQSIPRSERFSFLGIRFVDSCLVDSISGVGGPEIASLPPNSGVPV